MQIAQCLFFAVINKSVTSSNTAKSCNIHTNEKHKYKLTCGSTAVGDHACCTANAAASELFISIYLSLDESRDLQTLNTIRGLTASTFQIASRLIPQEVLYLHHPQHTTTTTTTKPLNFYWEENNTDKSTTKQAAV